jgi:hypothetical protein
MDLEFDFMKERAKKERALELLSAHREQRIIAARAIAKEIHDRQGAVTSPQVIAELRRRGFEPDEEDKRFMGAVFRAGWKRIGYEPSGSHCRPVSVWVLK